MQLTHAESSPAEGQEAVANALDRIVEDDELTRAVLGPVGFASLGVTEPHPVYGIGLDRVAGGSLLADARLTAWRYLVTASDSVVAAVDLDENGELVRVVRGPIVDETVAAIQYAEGLEDDDKGFEVRALELRGVHFAALWLSGPRDVLVPILSATEGLDPLRHFEENEVIERLRPHARQIVELDPEPIDGADEPPPDSPGVSTA